MHGGPPIAAIVLRYEYPFNVTRTGARTLPNAAFGSKPNEMKHIEPSRKIVALNVFELIVRASFLRNIAVRYRVLPVWPSRGIDSRVDEKLACQSLMLRVHQRPHGTA